MQVHAVVLSSVRRSRIDMIPFGIHTYRYQKVSYRMSQLAFRALADPTRRAIILHLQDGDLTIAQLAANFEMTRAAVKKHLTILADAGLISTRTQGRERYNSFTPDGLSPVRDWISDLDRFWDDRLGDLKTAIEKDTT